MSPPDRTPNDDRWLAGLRAQFLDVASRRVPADEVEDVVQQALATVYRRGQELGREERVDGMPPVAWCFQVLRNTVGNFYKQRRNRERVIELRTGLGPEELAANSPCTPAEALDRSESATIVDEALRHMRDTDPRCHGYIRQVMEGRKARAIARAEGLEEAVFYRRLYRCRQKLRERLRARGVLP
jgi:RNA polymerase sigma factor (sigma-70 family)